MQTFTIYNQFLHGKYVISFIKLIMHYYGLDLPSTISHGAGLLVNLDFVT